MARCCQNTPDNTVILLAGWSLHGSVKHWKSFAIESPTTNIQHEKRLEKSKSKIRYSGHGETEERIERNLNA